MIEAVLGPLHFRLLITGDAAVERTILATVDLVIGGLRSSGSSADPH